MALESFYRTHRFAAPPFESWIAEDERHLPNWFVKPTFLRTLLGALGGSAARPTPSTDLVFGEPGSGKTALRVTLERELLGHLPNALVVRYVDFGSVLAAGQRPQLSAHVEELLRLSTVSLIGYWGDNPSAYAHLSSEQKSELSGLVAYYFSSLPPDLMRRYTEDLSPTRFRLPDVAKTGGKALIEVYNATVAVLHREKIEPIQWKQEADAATDHAAPMLRMQRFWHLARAMGVDSLWVLVDSVDEAPNVRTATQVFQCIAELLLAQRLIEFRDTERQVMCFKVFLTMPDDVERLLRDERFRFDRISSQRVAWQRRDMDEALRRRLSFYSGGHCDHFDQLCQPDAVGTHDRLLDRCALRPRAMFRMAHEIVSAFDRRNVTDQSLIDLQSVEEGVVAGVKAVFGDVGS